MVVGEEQTASADAVRAELQRILASPAFDASERNRKLPRLCRRGGAGGPDRAHQGLRHRDLGLQTRRGLRPAARFHRPYRGRPAQALARALLSDRGPGEPPADRHPARRVHAGVPPHRSGAGPAGSGRLAKGAGDGLGGGGRPVVLPELHPRLHPVADHRAHPLHRPARLRHRDRFPPPGRRRPAGRQARSRRGLHRDRPDLAPARPLRGGRPPRRGGERPRRLGRDLRAHAATLRDHRAPQRGGEPRRAGAGAAIRRHPERPGARRRRAGARDPRQLRGGPALLRLLADLRPGDDRGGADRARTRGGDASRTMPRRTPASRSSIPTPSASATRSARPTPTPASGRFRSPPAPSSSRRTRAGPATPSAWRAGSRATSPARSTRWRPAVP